jgi:5'-deoxynucleotidase YfbR-like HD superfamily hydrolase
MLNDLLHLSYVKRWTICDMLREQSVAEHSYRVAVIAREIALVYDNTEFTATVVSLALSHDGDEADTGDAPSPSKGHSDFHTLSREMKIVKVADNIEALFWVTRHGNRLSSRTMKAMNYMKHELDRKLVHLSEDQPVYRSVLHVMAAMQVDIER